MKPAPTMAGIEEEIRLLKLDAAEPDLSGQPPKRFLASHDWISARMKAAVRQHLSQSKPPEEE